MATAGSNFCLLSFLLLAAVCEARLSGSLGPLSPVLDVPLTPPPQAPARTSELSTTFYSQTCPQANTLVKKLVDEILNNNRNLAAAFQRLQFHDCWVNGCDGSVLLNSTSSNAAERDGFTNFKIRGFEEIDQIKDAVEKICPDTVSCADIIALAARDATVHVGGQSWSVALGRRDSGISRATDAETNLPFPSMNFTELVENFANKGFNSREMIVLSGSHTIGRTHCNGVAPNLYNYTGIEDLTNPNLDPDFANVLKKECPKGNRDNIVDMDPTKNDFDRAYYTAVLNKKGVFISDLALIEDSLGKSVVTELVKANSSFFQEFADGMAKMSKLSPLTGTKGEIRKHCQFVN